MSESLRLDLDQARRFLRVLDPEASYRSLLSEYPDGFTFQTFDDVKDRKQRELASVIHGEFDLVSERLKRLNAKRAGVFVMINETNGQGRTALDVIRIRAIWVDDDSRLNIPLPVDPHLITETSPGKFHKIILVDGLSFEQHRQLQHVLIDKYGSDPNAKDVARVLRLPGFFHCKGTPFRVTLTQALDTPPYPASYIMDIFEAHNVSTAAKKQSSTTPYQAPSAPIDGYSTISLSDPLPDITVDNAYDYLPPPGDQSYSEWLHVGFALYHQFQGSDEGLAIFDRWSVNVREYQGYDDVADQWSRMGNRTTGPEITFRSIIQAHNARVGKQKAERDLTAAEEGTQLIESCTDYLALVREVAPKLWRLADKNVALEKDFENALIARYSVLRPGSTLSKSDARRAMKMPAPSNRNQIIELAGLEDARTPYWAKGWVWVSQEEIFFHTVTRVDLTSTGFSGHYNSYLPKGDNAPSDAAKYVRDNNLIPKVMGSMYAPQQPALFEFEGVSFVNSYTEAFRPPIPEVIVNEKAAMYFKQHIELICGGWNREAQILANWLAAATDSPPRKIRWAPLVVGVFGDGKSFFFDFMVKALGQSNTRTISCSSIIAGTTSGQSGWAEGACLGFLEEIKLHGHNRFDVMNNLKAYITNSIVPCKKLFKEIRNILNTMNYFIATNYKDAAPIEEGDRRYYILYSKLVLKELEKRYFKDLYRAIHYDCGSIVRWLRSVPVHEDFDIDGVAPMTEDKQTTIRLTSDDTRERIAEYIEDDASEEYGEDIVLFDSLLNRLASSTYNVKTDNSRILSTALSALGYEKIGRARINGTRHSIWANHNAAGKKLTLAEAKDIMEVRLKDAEAKGLRLVS